MAIPAEHNPPSRKRRIAGDRSVSAQIFEFIRDAIVGMEFQPGQMIPETALAEQFGVSRTPVREALIKLSNIGFVDVLPQRGTYVSRFSMEKILEARFIREALELAVISSVAEQADDALIQACEHILHEQQLAADNDNALAFQKLDDHFHQTLASRTQYPRVAQLIESEKAHMDRVRNLSLHISGQYRHVLEQHRAILEAVKSHDPVAARQAMSVHMQDVYKVLTLIPQEHPEYFTDE
ncbi:GntR family transcriptional regulator [Marinimicrobium sp. ARAG 43.8]|uniref:GntR family transcriptional regulator n=1 Tax=Marinimicrobium sp. ARAG 43.8 TaxID=3418719 RepID=UPI003CF4A92C